jgi:hypothetical protein
MIMSKKAAKQDDLYPTFLIESAPNFF